MFAINNGQSKLDKVDLLVIVVNWNTKALLHRCLQSLRMCQNSIKFDVVVIDNGSTDGSAEMLEAEFLDYHIVLSKENMGFGKANNFAFRSFPQAAYYLLLNSDASVTPDVIRTMLDFIKENANIAAIGPALKLPTGQYQLGSAGWGPNWIYSFNTFFLLSNISRLFRGLFIFQEQYSKSRVPIMVNWLACTCILIRTQAIEDVGLFDERYFVYGEDSDWCWHARKKGWKIAYLPYVSVLHDVGASSPFKAQQNPAWFINLASAVKQQGGRINYALFLLFGLIGYSVRLAACEVKLIIKRNESSRERRHLYALLLKTCYKLLFSPGEIHSDCN